MVNVYKWNIKIIHDRNNVWAPLDPDVWIIYEVNVRLVSSMPEKIQGGQKSFRWCSSSHWSHPSFFHLSFFTAAEKYLYLAYDFYHNNCVIHSRFMMRMFNTKENRPTAQMKVLNGYRNHVWLQIAWKGRQMWRIRKYNSFALWSCSHSFNLHCSTQMMFKASSSCRLRSAMLTLV